MQHARIVKPDGSSEVVDATGRPLGHGDSDCPLLHIVPRLYVPLDLCSRIALRPWEDRRASLSLTVSGSPISIEPEGGIVVRQPYPNRRYFVGGSATHRNGWTVPVPPWFTEGKITFEWCLENAWLIGFDQDAWRVSHEIAIHLAPGAGRVYTMDASCWPDSYLSASQRRPLITTFEGPLDSPVVSTKGSLVDEGGATTGWWFMEDVTIPGVPREQAWALDAHEEEQLHEVTQTASLTDDHDRAAHEINGPVVLPAELFARAVALARDVPYQKRFAGAEDHPAVTLLCRWWDTMRPTGEPYPPGFLMPWVRVRDDGFYWPGYHEIPSEEVDGFNNGGRNMARVGDLILVAFYATQRVARHKPGEVTIYLPSGEPYARIGADWDDYQSGVIDEAWYGLQALAQFPDVFPAAWEAVTKSVAMSK